MLKSRELVSLIASEADLDFDDVMLKARRLREAGLFVRETRSPNSPRVTFRHIANLLTMLLSEEPASSAEQTIQNVESMKAEYIEQKLLEYNFERRNLPNFFASDIPTKHNFVDILEILIGFSSKNNEYGIEFDHLFENITVDFFKGTYTADVIINFHAFKPQSESNHEYNYVKLHYDSSRFYRKPPKGFLRISRIDFDFLMKIGFHI